MCHGNILLLLQLFTTTTTTYFLVLHCIVLIATMIRNENVVCYLNNYKHSILNQLNQFKFYYLFYFNMMVWMNACMYLKYSSCNNYCKMFATKCVTFVCELYVFCILAEMHKTPLQQLSNESIRLFQWLTADRIHWQLTYI